MPRLIIFANGILPELELARRLIQAGDVLIAADGGTRHVLALGLFPSIVIGDLDSLTPDERRRLDAKGVEIQQYSRDKDETDLELAFHYACTVPGIVKYWLSARWAAVSTRHLAICPC